VSALVQAAARGEAREALPLGARRLGEGPASGHRPPCGSAGNLARSRSVWSQPPDLGQAWRPGGPSASRRQTCGSGHRAAESTVAVVQTLL